MLTEATMTITFSNYALKHSTHIPNFSKKSRCPTHCRHGTYRKITFDVFDYGEYLQRNKIKTLNRYPSESQGSHISLDNHKI